ncbi:Sucraseferredoxin-like protein [Scheffersomyces coipomensis]|uniref:Sucraseferredoxin-like protein n=1 Tax=Scheffersomyces coipomensis TaxID=1788519 RepID=UPI00315DABC7
MGLFDKLIRRTSQNHDEEVKSKGFEIADCSFDCESCDSKFPASLKFDDEADLWNSTKPYGLHFIVSTGKTDWAHDATGESNTLSHSVSKWAGNNAGNFVGLESSAIKTSVSSLSSDELLINDDYKQELVGDILVLPFFIWIKNIHLNQVDEFLSTFIPKLIEFRAQNLTSLNFDSFKQEFPTIKLEVDTFKSYVFLCSHKHRDKRCGITAPIMKKEIEIHLRDLQLYRDVGDNTPNGVKVAFINHIGGHKFSANVIIYLRNSGKNIWLARCRPNNVRPIIDQCILNDGKIWPDNVRLIQKFHHIEW